LLSHHCTYEEGERVRKREEGEEDMEMIHS
jgi:hypothetical protein